MSEDAEFSIRVRVYYEDTDFSGVVYHARHLHFFERGRTEALRAVGVSHTELLAREEPLAFAVRKMTTEWITPAKIDDMLEVTTRFRAVKGARMALHQEMRRVANEADGGGVGTLIARAEVEAACMNLDGRPRRLPAEIARRLGVAAR